MTDAEEALETGRSASVMEEVRREYQRARGKFLAFHSRHEGYAVIREELDELWEAVKKDDASGCRREAIQVGAMALAFVLECCTVPADPKGTPWDHAEAADAPRAKPAERALVAGMVAEAGLQIIELKADVKALTARRDKAETERDRAKEDLLAARAQRQKLYELLVKLSRLVDFHEAHPLKFADLPEVFERMKAEAADALRAMTDSRDEAPREKSEAIQSNAEDCEAVGRECDAAKAEIEKANRLVQDYRGQRDAAHAETERMVVERDAVFKRKAELASRVRSEIARRQKAEGERNAAYAVQQKGVAGKRKAELDTLRATLQDIAGVFKHGDDAVTTTQEGEQTQKIMHERNAALEALSRGNVERQAELEAKLAKAHEDWTAQVDDEQADCERQTAILKGDIKRLEEALDGVLRDEQKTKAEVERLTKWVQQTQDHASRAMMAMARLFTSIHGSYSDYIEEFRAVDRHLEYIREGRPAHTDAPPEGESPCSD